MKRFFFALSLLLSTLAFGQSAVPAGSTLVTQTTTRLDASACQAASGTAQQTITITPGPNQYAYITWISSSAWATSAPAASSVTTTTTNLNASPIAAFGLTATAGVSNYVFVQPTTPLKSATAGTNVTVVTNAAIPNVTFGLVVCYYISQ